MITIYHNPRCSKSREALELLESRGVALQVIRYLETPPDIATLKKLLKQLGIPARELLRRQEAEYTELGLDDPALKEEALIKTMSQHPRLIERPIATDGQQTVIGRPPEKVLELLK